MYKDATLKSQKGQTKPMSPSREGQPPDLWIDHDHLELKSMGKDDRGESSISIASTRRNSLSSVNTHNPGKDWNVKMFVLGNLTLSKFDNDPTGKN